VATTLLYGRIKRTGNLQGCWDDSVEDAGSSLMVIPGLNPVFLGLCSLVQKPNSPVLLTTNLQW